MKNFGKFSASPETLNVMGQEIHLVFQRNEAGEDLVDALKSNPHPFYIAVDNEGVVISMESDPEAIQIADFEIIGIDEDFGFTRGENGNVNGAIWNGEAIIAPPPVQPVLTARQFWQAALELGITENGLLAAIADETNALYIEDEGERAAAAIDITKAQNFRRDYPLVDEMAAAFGLSMVEMDSLWAWAAQIE